MSKYKFSDSVKPVTVEVYENGLYINKQVVGIFPYGIQSGVITEDMLTDSMCEYLMTKAEYQNTFVSNDNKETKTKDRKSTRLNSSH